MSSENMIQHQTIIAPTPTPTPTPIPTPTPTNEGVVLRMAVPVSPFKEFINISYNRSSGEKYLDGFTIQVFREIIKGLINPPTFDLVPYARKDGTINVSYDSMAQAVANKVC